MWWDQYPNRKVEELTELAKHFPCKIVKAPIPASYCPVCQSQGRDHDVHISVFTRMRLATGRSYLVVMVYPCDFPNRIPGSWPQIRWGQTLPPHLFDSGRVCLTGNETDPSVTGAMVLSWTYDWLTCYEVFRYTGTFPNTNWGRHQIK